MKTVYARLSLVFFLLVISVAPVAAEEVRLSVAGSLIDAVNGLVAEYAQAHPGTELLPNFASSGALAKQIVAGAPADIYISANQKWMEHLQQQGLIAEAGEQVLVHNRLVFVGLPGTSAQALPDLARLKRIALGSPASVSAGRHAEQALSAAGLYEQLSTENKLVLAKDVRQALLYAERGEVDGAFVFHTDALLARQAVILFDVPQQLHPQISYPAAMTSTGVTNLAAQQFFTYLFSVEAQQVFHKYGFLIP